MGTCGQLTSHMSDSGVTLPVIISFRQVELKPDFLVIDFGYIECNKLNLFKRP